MEIEALEVSFVLDYSLANGFWDGDLQAGNVLESDLGISTYLRVKEVETGKGRSWTLLKTQKKASVDSCGALLLEWVVQSGDKHDGPLHMSSGGDMTLDEGFLWLRAISREWLNWERLTASPPETGEMDAPVPSISCRTGLQARANIPSLKASGMPGQSRLEVYPHTMPSNIWNFHPASFPWIRSSILT